MPTSGGNPRDANSHGFQSLQILVFSTLQRLETLDSFHNSNDLVTQNDRQMGRGCPPFNLVQLCMADSTPRNAQQDLARGRSWLLERTQTQGSRMRLQIGKRLQEHRFHFGGRLDANSTPSLTHTLSCFSVLKPSAPTNSQPFIGLPVRSKGFVCGFLSSTSCFSGSMRTMRLS